MLPVAPSNFPSARRSARLGVPANTAVASAALTSVGVRGTSLRTTTAHDLARSVVTSPHVAVVSRRLMVVLLGNRALNNEIPSQRASETLAADEGRGAKRPAKLLVRCSGSRVRLPLPASSRFGGAKQPIRGVRSRCERGAGRTEAGAGQVTRHRRRGRTTRPTHSLKWTRNGRPPWPGLRYAVHFLSPGQGVLPLRAP